MDLKAYVSFVFILLTSLIENFSHGINKRALRLEAEREVYKIEVKEKATSYNPRLLKTEGGLEAERRKM